MEQQYTLKDIKDFLKYSVKLKWKGEIIDPFTEKIRKAKLSDFEGNPVDLILESKYGNIILQRVLISDTMFELRSFAKQSTTSYSKQWIFNLDVKSEKRAEESKKLQKEYEEYNKPEDEFTNPFIK